MLTYFRVSNFKSIKAPIEFEMTRAPRLRRLSSHVCKPAPEQAPSLDVLKGALIYGANASGKSNFVKAIHLAKDIISRPRKSGKTIPIEKFKLDDYAPETEFYFEFVMNGCYYSYGIVVEENVITNEILRDENESGATLIYSRKYNKESSEYVFDTELEFDNKSLDFLSSLSSLTIENNTFLCNFDELDVSRKLDKKNINALFSDHVLSAFIFFRASLVVIHPGTKYGGLYSDLREGKCGYISALKKFDTGINDIKLKVLDSNRYSEYLEDWGDELRESKDSQIVKHVGSQELCIELDENEEIKVSEIATYHSSANKNIIFKLDEESDGTKRLLDLLPVMEFDDLSLEPDSINFSYTFIIDEFDRSLHPNLAKEFVKLFFNGSFSSQLIMTTHQDSLLDLTLLRRDEIWFVQKENDGSSALYSLDEYSARFDKDIRSAYLNGKFGAIPNLNSF